MTSGDKPVSPLREAVREIRTRAADRDDVVVELREASRTRLELLLAELEPIIADIPPEMDIFDFAVSSGLQPRLWIDHVAHVALGRDRRTYLFQRDTRAGRVVLAESAAIPTIVETVTRYIAERIVERERALDGPVVARAEPTVTETRQTVAEPFQTQEPAAPTPAALAAEPVPSSPAQKFFSGLLLIVSGALAGLAIAALVFWDRVQAYLDSMNLGN
ncbi:hypothetical protein NGM99_14955 [Mesorhizobium sp. RP14(2022)]|uniref:Uncharacterized protein n=1 Tax=Mesorhizobium liriopis TaxID=2953882 RepID=A0ABT1CAS2_9HYPH|nr:hypothetical protein [Mesorhizobium liriopis]MCO6051081.1 hypothetical protein [Mesorhizobium liriopis]